MLFRLSLLLMMLLGLLLMMQPQGSTQSQQENVMAVSKPAQDNEAVPEAVKQSMRIAEGRRLYRNACACCHGLSGKGDGEASRYLSPKPRDFSFGSFKWRSTPSGSLPTDEDIANTIKRGAKGTAMPSFRKLFTDEQIWSLVAFIKTLSPRFAQEQPEEPIKIPDEIPVTKETIARGKKLYEENKCWECHGKTGRGDGPAAPTLKDDWKRPIQAFDFTTGVYRCGGTNKDIYRTFITGLDGTPMPSYADAIPDEKDRWCLVHFVRSLQRKKSWYEAPDLAGVQP